MPIVQISALLFSLFGCSGLPTDRESMELVSIDQTGRLAVFRFSQGDTGWLKGTGHFKATIWDPDQDALEFWDHAPADHVTWTDTKISIGVRHTLQRAGANWQLDSHFDEWNLRVLGTCSGTSEEWSVTDTWSTVVPCPNMNNTGWTQSHEQSQMLKGASLLVSHKGTQPIDGMMLMAATPALHFTLEMVEDSVFGQITFRVDENWTTQPIKEITATSNGWLITTETERIQIDNLQVVGVEDPHQHIMDWERRLASTVAPMHTIQWSKGRGVWKDTPFVVVIRQHSS